MSRTAAEQTSFIGRAFTLCAASSSEGAELEGGARRSSQTARMSSRARFVAFSKRLWFDSLVLGVAGLIVRVTPSPAWIERHYSNGIYPRIDTVVRSLTGPLPFAVGDVLALTVACALTVFYLSRGRALRRRGVSGFGVLGEVALALVRTVSIAALVGVWFLGSWGYGYSRVSLADKVPVHNDRTNEDTVTAYANHVYDELNANAVPAHAELDTDLATLAARLRPTWLATIHRLGDTADFAPYAPKPTIFDGFMNASGTTGFTDPWTHEVNLPSSLFAFERPAIYAHEWSHLAGFSDETEANYIAVVSCTTARDPLLRYSGWILIWDNLPHDVKPTHHLTKRAYDDLVAIYRRYQALVKPQVQQAARGAYDHYLKANHVKAGYDSYQLFIRWLTGADYDRDGLPIVRAAPAT